MLRFVSRVLALLAVSASIAACGAASAASGPVPPPAVDAPLAAKPGRQVAVIAGGCFWGIEAVYRHTKGVISAVSGYTGGSRETAQYEMVGEGTTGHAEAVQVTYDPSKITFGTILQVFFAVAHDPTQLNKQGPDYGSQYRSSIFFADAEQQRIAAAYVAQLDDAKMFRKKIVTQMVPLTKFYEAEDYHQNYAALHPDEPYIRIHDAPKVAALQKYFPALFVKR